MKELISIGTMGVIKVIEGEGRYRMWCCGILQIKVEMRCFYIDGPYAGPCQINQTNR